MIVAFGALTACLAAGYGVLFTVLDDYREEYGIAEGSLGAIIGIGFVSAFVAQILLAPLADRGHARRIVLLGVFANLVGVTLLAFGTAFVPLLMGRLVMGIGLGMAMPAIRRIVIIADPDNLGHNLGRLLSIDVAGFAVGPIVSAVFVGPFGIAAPYLVVVAATVAALPLAWRVDVRENTGEAAANAQRFAFDLLRRRAFVAAVALGCAMWMMIGAFDSLWAVAHRDLETSRWIANLGITLFALPLVLFGALGGRLAQRLGPFRVATVGLTLASMWMLLYGQAATGGIMFAIAMVHAVSDGLTMSSTGVAVGMVVPAERQAGAQGVLGGFQTLMAGVMASVAGLAYEHLGRAAAYTVSAAAMFVVVVVGVLLAGRDWNRTGRVTEGLADSNPSPVPGQPGGAPPALGASARE